MFRRENIEHNFPNKAEQPESPTLEQRKEIFEHMLVPMLLVGAVGGDIKLRKELLNRLKGIFEKEGIEKTQMEYALGYEFFDRKESPELIANYLQNKIYSIHLAIPAWERRRMVEDHVVRYATFPQPDFISPSQAEKIYFLVNLSYNSNIQLKSIIYG